MLDKFIDYGLRDLPTEQYPDQPRNNEDGKIPVTLSTSTAQEVYFYVKANYPDSRLLQPIDDDLEYDIHPGDRNGAPFQRPESQELYRRLPEFRPSVLYVFGQKSEASPPNYRRDKVERTGIGVGGSGGATTGKVESVVLNTGHLVAMEQPAQCAEACAAFIDSELGRWDAQEKERLAKWRAMSRRERVDINEEWKRRISGDVKQNTSGTTGSKL